MSQELTALLIGSAIGIVSSLIGAFISYRLYLRNNQERTGGPLGVMLIINGVLALVGFIAIITSLFVNQLSLAILTGVGVFIGLSITFGILSYLWTRSNSSQSNTD